MSKKLTKDVEHAIKWLAAEYHFLKKLHEDLEELEEHEKDKKVIKYFKAPRKDVRRIGKSERIVERDVEKVIKQLREGRGKSSSPEKVDKLLKEINIPAGELLKNGSIYVGSLRKQLKEIRSKAALERKYKDNPELGAEVHKEIEELDVKVNKLIGWIAALEIGLKKVEKIENLELGTEHEKTEKSLNEKIQKAVKLNVELRTMKPGSGESKKAFDVFNGVYSDIMKEILGKEFDGIKVMGPWEKYDIYSVHGTYHLQYWLEFVGLNKGREREKIDLVQQKIFSKKELLTEDWTQNVVKITEILPKKYFANLTKEGRIELTRTVGRKSSSSYNPNHYIDYFLRGLTWMKVLERVKYKGDITEIAMHMTCHYGTKIITNYQKHDDERWSERLSKLYELVDKYNNLSGTSNNSDKKNDLMKTHNKLAMELTYEMLEHLAEQIKERYLK